MQEVKKGKGKGGGHHFRNNKIAPFLDKSTGVWGADIGKEKHDLRAA